MRYLDLIHDVWASPLLYDIDGDGNLEILVENWEFNAVVTAYRWDRGGDTLIGFRGRLIGLWKYDDPYESDYTRGHVHFSACGLNEDGWIEVLAGLATGDWITAVLDGRTGGLITYFGPTRPYIADLDTDPYPDVLLTPAGDASGLNLYQLYPTEGLVWSKGFFSWGEHAIISDVDGDGKNEIIVVGNKVMVLDGGDVEVAEGIGIPTAEAPKVIYENGKAWLLFPSGAPEGTLVKIYDVRGALFKEESPPPDERMIPIRVQTKGVYFVLIKTPEGVFRTKVIIK